MLSFSPEFFEPEVRCGYFISEQMKRFWAASLEVLNVVNTVAEKHRLTLYADFGTLLGTVRHGGFIPWDDDIDVSMLRGDYQKLMQFLPAELPEGYRVYNHVGPHIPMLPKAFVSNSTRIEMSPEYMKARHGCPLITGIDVFPIDTVPDDENLRETQKALYNVVYDAAFSFDKYKADGSIYEYLDQIEEVLNTKIDRNGDIKAQLWVLSDRVASLFGPREGNRVCYMADIITNGDFKMRQKSWYSSKYHMKFENMELAVPGGYDKLLQTYYRSYFKAVRGLSRHDHPVYKRLDPEGQYMEKHYDFKNAPQAAAAGTTDPGKVLFLLKNADKWRFFKNIYDAENNGTNDIRIVMLPYSYKDATYTRTDEVIVESGRLPEGLPVVSADEYDIKSELPGRVYIQDPYDSYSLSSETDQRFFTESIRPYAGEISLVIPYEVNVLGKEDEMSKEMFRPYLDTPGCYLSNRVLVHDESFKDFLEQFDSVKGKISVFS